MLPDDAQTYAFYRMILQCVEKIEALPVVAEQPPAVLVAPKLKNVGKTHLLDRLRGVLSDFFPEYRI